MQMKANKAFYVIGGITALVVTLMAGFLFSGSSSTTTAETKKETRTGVIKGIPSE